jgi:hypothetical protein
VCKKSCWELEAETVYSRYLWMHPTKAHLAFVLWQSPELACADTNSQHSLKDSGLPGDALRLEVVPRTKDWE